MIRWMALVGLVAGCNAEPECGSFDEVRIDEAGFGPDETARIRGVLSEFQAETGRDTTCLTAIGEQDMGDVLYRHDPNARHVAVKPGHHLPEAFIRRALCHHLDEQEGISTNLNFGPGSEERRDTFVELCAAGPGVEAVYEAFATCGADATAADIVAVEVFQGNVADRLMTGPVIEERTPLSYIGHGDYGYVQSSVNGWTTHRQVRVDDRYEVTLIESDFDGTILREFTLEVEEQGASLLAGVDEDPLLVLQNEAFRWVGDELVPSPFPVAPNGRMKGELADGFAYIDRNQSLERVNLATGAAEEMLSESMRVINGVGAAHGKVAVSFVGTKGHENHIMLYDVADDIWTTVELPAGIMVPQVQPTADGVVAVWWGPSSETTGVATFSEVGGWQLDEAPCSADATQNFGDFLVSGGDTYFMEWGDDSPGNMVKLEL